MVNVAWDQRLVLLSDDDVAAIVLANGDLILDGDFESKHPRGEGGKWTDAAAGQLVDRMDPKVQKAAQGAADKLDDVRKMTLAKMTKSKLYSTPNMLQIAERISEAQASGRVILEAVKPLLKDPIAKAVAEMIPERWVQSANHHESDLLKIAVAKSFGGNVYDSGAARLLETPAEIDKLAAKAVDRMDSYYRPLVSARAGGEADPKKVVDDLAKFAQVQYAVTQTRLKAAGVPDEVVVFRGVKITGSSAWKPGQTVDMKLGSVSSFSDTAKVADCFGPVTVKVVIPRSRIFATSRTGIGDTSEGEYLVLGGTKPIAATVTRVEDKSWFFTPEPAVTPTKGSK